VARAAAAITADTATNIAQAVVAPYTNQVTGASIVAAGGVTNAALSGVMGVVSNGTAWLNGTDPVLIQTDIAPFVVGGTATLTRTYGNCMILATNVPLVITADATLTAGTLASVFWLDLFAGTNQITWVTTAITNASSTALSTTGTNSLIFTKGAGATILKGKVD